MTAVNPTSNPPSQPDAFRSSCFETSNKIAATILIGATIATTAKVCTFPITYRTDDSFDGDGNDSAGGWAG
jgi:hypothetical protein